MDYAYAGIGRVVTLNYPAPGAQLSYLQPGGDPGQSDAGDDMAGYDRFNRTMRMPWKKTTGGSVLADIAYGFDAASRRKWRQDLTPGAEAAFDRFYGYDTLGQVKSADRGTLNENRTAIGGIPEEAEAWNYDEQGNWLAYLKKEDGINEIDQTRRNNQSNQITMVDGSNAGVAYDKNGNMLRVPIGEALTGPPRQLKWNAWNQLVEVRNDSDQLLQRNTYDGLFRRTTRELNDSSLIHCYYNDQWRPVEERIDSSTDPSAVYYWGARYRDDLARRDRDTTGGGTLDESLWCLMDYFDPIAVIDDEGDVVERYDYNAFGVASFLAPDYTVRTSSQVNWNFLFHGQFADEETGWQNYGYRFYVPEMGRWPNRDPLQDISFVFSLSAFESEMNNDSLYQSGFFDHPYVFVDNSPASSIDFKGLAPFKHTEKTCNVLSENCEEYSKESYPSPSGGYGKDPSRKGRNRVCIRFKCEYKCYCPDDLQCPNFPCPAHKLGSCSFDHGTHMGPYINTTKDQFPLTLLLTGGLKVAPNCAQTKNKALSDFECPVDK